MDARRLRDPLDELAFEVRLGGEALAGPRPPDRRSLHQEDVEVPRRAIDHSLEQRLLAPMGPKIARVEDPPAVGFDQQGVGVEGAVIDEIGRDAERPDLHRRPVGDEARVGEGVTARHIGARGRHDVVSRLADPDRDLWADISGEAVVVLMGMRDHHAEQAVVRLPEPRNLRQ